MNPSLPLTQTIQTTQATQTLRVALFLGGASNERNISLDSARTFYDSIRESIYPENILLVFLSPSRDYYLLNPSWVYANTIQDFETLLDPTELQVTAYDELLPHNLAPEATEAFEASEASKASKHGHSPTTIRHAGQKLSASSVKLLIEKTDILVPLIHGEGGEDGGLTGFFETLGRKAVVGSGREALLTSFKKDTTKALLEEHGFATPRGLKLSLSEDPEWKTYLESTTHAEKPQTPSVRSNALEEDLLLENYPKNIAISIEKTVKNLQVSIQELFNNYSINSDRVIVKPNTGGSSDGVALCNLADTTELFYAIREAFQFSSEVLIEQFISGKEFSIIVIEKPREDLPKKGPNRKSKKESDKESDKELVAFFPTEIAMRSLETEEQLYTRQKKYMPESSTEHHTPARFSQTDLFAIMEASREIFKIFGMEDWARFDGFLTNTHEVIWNEINGIPGYGMDGLIFQQSTLWNLSSTQLSLMLLETALAKEGRSLYGSQNEVTKTEAGVKSNASLSPASPPLRKRRIAVVGGGESSERQVSRMSWFNVIEKLSSLRRYTLTYLFMDRELTLWELPRFLTLKHTVEEIEAILHDPTSYKQVLDLVSSSNPFTAASLPYKEIDAQSITNFLPRKVSLGDLKERIDFMFIALHGGIGENGTFQKQLEAHSIPFNGSPSLASQLANDKFETQTVIRSLHLPGILTATSDTFSIGTLKKVLTKVLTKTPTGNSLNPQYESSPTDLSAASLEKLIVAAQDDISAVREQHPILFKLLEAKSKELLEKFMKELHSPKGVVIKPRQDGCSTAVWIFKQEESEASLSEEQKQASFVPVERQAAYYFLALLSRLDRIPSSLLSAPPTSKLYPETLTYIANNWKSSWLEMPPTTEKDYETLEMLVETAMGGLDIIELTMGVLEKDGKLLPLLPSQTIAEDQILTLDEKFHKGMGVNLTPPQQLSSAVIAKIQQKVVTLATKLGIRGYARIDVFYNTTTEEITVIELNTLPGLTVATVFYTQALLTPGTALKPADLLSHIIEERLRSV